MYYPGLLVIQNLVEVLHCSVAIVFAVWDVETTAYNIENLLEIHLHNPAIHDFFGTYLFFAAIKIVICLGVYCLQYDDDKIISGLRDHTIKIWQRKDLQCSKTLRGHTGSVLCLQYDDRVIISGSSDTTVRYADIV